MKEYGWIIYILLFIVLYGLGQQHDGGIINSVLTLGIVVFFFWRLCLWIKRRADKWRK